MSNRECKKRVVYKVVYFFINRFTKRDMLLILNIFNGFVEVQLKIIFLERTRTFSSLFRVRVSVCAHVCACTCVNVRVPV